MGQKTIDHLIINSPYKEPSYYWKYDRNTRLFDKVEGRRPAGYLIASPGAQSFDDPGVFIEIPLVNKIRPRVKQWRESGYKGVTGITKRLLEHWNDEERQPRFFFCQLEAIETLIWLTEAPASSRVGIEVPSDGGLFQRLCSKMATGSGKTVVMAMLIAWQGLNKITYPKDTRFSKNFLVMAPGLTVKERLQVLKPSHPENYYDEFQIVPVGLIDKLRQARIIIHNWQALDWQSEKQIKKKKSVDKRGTKSDEAYTREVLGDMSRAKNLVVINDEAHHAWRIPAESKVKGLKKDQIEEATKWIGGLDRLHKTRNILYCYDFSATPFAPSGKKSYEEALFDWIVSDFSLNDAIESGLVKTPRVVVRDDAAPDAKTYKSKLFHIYPEVKDDINRKADPEEPLPDLIKNAYYLLGKDWLDTAKDWEKSKRTTPPVMITVANITHTAARIKYMFDHKKIDIDELCNPEKTLHIDSKELEKAESQIEALSISKEGKSKLTKTQKAELLRETVDTIGKRGMQGEQIQNVISVGMLSEGWDTKTVTHIMGLRAFSSQLLCEQVVGRGLRRTSYDDFDENGYFLPEYVNIFGVPFTFIPHEAKGGDGPPPPPKPKTEIQPIDEKKEFEISWPNIIRIEHLYKPELQLDLRKIKPLELDASETRQIADLAQQVEGKPDLKKITQIQIEDLGRKNRMQRIIFRTAAENYERMKNQWKGNKDYLLAQLIRLVEKFISTGKIRITPELFNQSELKKRIVITLNMNKVVQHIGESIRYENTKALEPVFDKENPIRSTGDMRTWYTSKPCEYTRKSNINYCVYDSAWEACEAFELDQNENVSAWAKNDHLGFGIPYIFDGKVKQYRPDFIIKLTTGDYLILETKGRNTQRDKTKKKYLEEWVKAVNQHSGFGNWSCDVSYDPSDVKDILSNVVKGKTNEKSYL